MQFENYLMGINPVSKFIPRNIPEEYIIKILETARWAPSAENQQA